MTLDHLLAHLTALLGAIVPRITYSVVRIYPGCDAGENVQQTAPPKFTVNNETRRQLNVSVLCSGSIRSDTSLTITIREQAEANSKNEGDSNDDQTRSTTTPKTAS